MSVKPPPEPRLSTTDSDENRHFSIDHLNVDLGRRTTRSGAATVASQAIKFFTSMTAETGAYENELMQVSLSHPNNIRRLLHHRSVVDNKTDASGDWAAPKPTISREGRFVAFTSNWGIAVDVICS